MIVPVRNPDMWPAMKSQSVTWRSFLTRQKSLEIAVHFHVIASQMNTCNNWCFLFQITLWPAVPTPKGSGRSSLTARAVHLGSRGVLPTPCFT